MCLHKGGVVRRHPHAGSRNTLRGLCPCLRTDSCWEVAKPLRATAASPGPRACPPEKRGRFCPPPKQTRKDSVLPGTWAPCPARCQPPWCHCTDEETKAERQGGLPQLRALGGRTGLGSEPRLPTHQLCLRGRVPSPRLRRKGTMLVSRRPPASLLRMQCRGSSPVTQLCNRHLHLVPERFSSPRKDPRARPHLSIPASRRLTTCNLLSASVGSPILDASH